MKQFPEPLGSIFLTGLDGFIYEFPEALARQHRVSSERIKELGHLPIAPYPGMVAPASADDEVSARHYVLRDDGQFGPHTDLLYGTAVSEDDGIYYAGLHFHPYGRFCGQIFKRQPNWCPFDLADPFNDHEFLQDSRIARYQSHPNRLGHPLSKPDRIWTSHQPEAGSRSGRLGGQGRARGGIDHGNQTLLGT